MSHCSDHCHIHPFAGRMGYKGKVMNRASRIAGQATTGQVCCSSTVWAESEGHLAVQGINIQALNLGPRRLKGVNGVHEIYLCR